MKLIKYMIPIFILIVLFTPELYAGYNIESHDIQKVSMNLSSSSSLTYNINFFGFKILGLLKLLLEGLLIIFIVYIGAQMIWSMGSDEEALSKSKRQIWYSVVALLFINMPGSLYNTFHKREHETINKIDAPGFKGGEQNLFFEWDIFGYTFLDKVVGFLEVMIFVIALIMLIYQSLKLISSRGREERITETKNKITYTILALVFVGIIEAWKKFAFDLNISRVTNIFGELANLSLFFAGPIAIFFLTLAAYYYITSTGDEEKIKKAKSIVINTILATLILLASYTFLLDLANL